SVTSTSIGAESPSRSRPTVAIGPPSPGSHGMMSVPCVPSRQSRSAVTKATAIAITLTHPADTPRRRRGRTSARSRNAPNGSARTSSASATEQVEPIGVDGAAHAEDHDDDGEPHGDLGHGDRDREEGEEQPDRIGVQAGEGDEVDVHGVEHELDAEEDPDRVAPREDPEEPDREHKGGDDEIGVEPGHAQSSRAK